MIEPAFPYVYHDDRGREDIAPGMTLRDYFAAAALTGILASRDITFPVWNAQKAYEAADAMLKERERG